MKAERVRRGWTIEEAASRMKIDKQTLYRWEHEESQPNATKILELAALYECDPGYLMQSDSTERVA